MAQNNREAWLKLYKLADKAGEISAWEWLFEAQMFGLRVPQSNETWYASIMGSGGPHQCYCFYKGNDALDTLVQMRDNLSSLDEENHEMEHYYMMQFMRLQNCIQVSFEEEDVISEEKLEHLQELGIGPDKKGLWPSLSDWSKGYHPWLIAEDQIELTTILLEKTLEIAQHYEDTPEALEPWEDFGNKMPIFTATTDKNGALVWTETEEIIDYNTAEATYTPLYKKGWEGLKKVRKKVEVIVAGKLYTGMPVQELPENRPQYHDPILVVNPEKGEILGFAMRLEENPDMEGQLLQIFLDAGICPELVLIADLDTYDILGTCLEAAEIDVDIHEGAAEILASIMSNMNDTLMDPDMFGEN
jgi:hypothetical protein